MTNFGWTLSTPDYNSVADPKLLTPTSYILTLYALRETEKGINYENTWN